MKPLLLEVQGFGPYVARQVIDFATLDRIFLIGGDTGAGKTTLFDAMSYALYGQPLGTRTEAGVRSRFADESLSTYVRFRFSAAGRTWEVYRSPHHARPALRGGGVVVEKVLTLAEIEPSGARREIVGKPREIDARLEREVVHLSHEQFSKILVLPQGEFQRFLEMSSDERGKLLQQLFPVAEHRALTDAARAAVAQTRKESDDLASRIREAQAGFDPSTFPEKAAQLRAAEAEARAVEGKASGAEAAALAALTEGRAQAAARSEAEHLRTRRAELEAVRVDVETKREALARHARALRVRPAARRGVDLRAAHDRAAALALTLAAERTAAEAKELAALSALGDVTVRETSLREAEAKQAAALARARLLTRRLEAEALARAAAEACEAGAAAIPAAEAARAAAQAAVEALARVADDREALQPRLTEARRVLGELRALGKEAARLLEWQSTLGPAAERAAGEAATTIAAAAAAVQRAQARLEAARHAREAQAAARLAASLTADAPCPVCGSCAHPAPAREEGAATDAAERIAAAETELELARTAHAAQEQAKAAREALAAAQRAAAEEAAAALQAAGFASHAAWVEAGRAAAELVKQLEEDDRGLEQRLAERARRAAELRAAEGALEAAKVGAAERQRELTRREAERDALRQECPEAGELEGARRAAEAEAAALARASEGERRALQAAREAVSAASAARAAAVRAVEENEAALVRTRGEQVAAGKELEEVLAAAQFGSAEEAAAAELAPAAEAQVRRAVEEWGAEVKRVEHRLGELAARITDGPAPDVAGLEAAHLTAAQAHRSAIEARVAAEGAVTALERTQARIAELMEQLRALTEAQAGLLQLARDLDGENPRRVDFPTYILTWWLGQVLARANQRLRTLSEGRYAFILRPAVGDKRSRAGLDVDVFDAHTADRRDVRSLSGGEKFLASLSLALGLADVIQAQAGGVELDTLFIDEGFGSLDANTMDRALEVIDQIGAHRRVGLISHVEAVKKAIPCQLLVLKSAGGSTVRRA